MNKRRTTSLSADVCFKHPFLHSLALIACDQLCLYLDTWLTILIPVSKLRPEPTETNTGLLLSVEVFTAAPNVLPYYIIPMFIF